MSGVKDATHQDQAEDFTVMISKESTVSLEGPACLDGPVCLDSLAVQEWRASLVSQA